MRWREASERWQGVRPAVRAPLAVGGLLLVAVAIAGAAIWIGGLLGPRDEVEPDRVAAVARGGGDGDPFAYADGRREDLEERAAFGHAHVIYAKSPGGALASAARTARFRDRIERAADEHGVDADTMEAMVLLESAGRPDVIAGDDPESAAGLAQILASTGTALLEMDIDLAESRRLTRQMASALRRAQRLTERAARADRPRRAERLRTRAARLERRAERARRERAVVDPRFDPDQALAGMGRYLAISTGRFGRDDLGVVAYHMGIGNLSEVIVRYLDRGSHDEVGDLVADEDLSYAQLFFDSSPTRNRRAWRTLAGLGDDSATYLWRVEAAREIMDLYRSDREELRRLERLHTAKATAEEVFHPEEETEVFEGPADLSVALDDGELVAIPAGGRYGYRVGNQLGALSDELGVDRSLYRALRPEALATLIYMTTRVREIAGGGRLTVTSAVRDREYQAGLTGRNPEATRGYSLHTAGYAFDVLRRYRDDEQAEAFQFVLDRMKSLGVIDYAVEPAAIHIAVSDRAEPLLE
jgi:hypothetical protein